MPTDVPTPEKQFIIYYDRPRDEINKAYTHYEIAKTLRKLNSTYNAEFNEALTFFGFTIDGIIGIIPTSMRCGCTAIPYISTIGSLSVTYQKTKL